MRIILDTHFLIWSLYNPNNLPRKVQEILKREDLEIEYSIVSLWETEIKHTKYPTKFVFNCEEIHRDASAVGYQLVDLKPPHVSTLGLLNEPTKRHKDPFDRILIAQAKCDNKYLLTHDKRLASYKEECVQYL